MSILSALKKKFNAKGGNIEEAIKTMEVGGGSSDEVMTVKFQLDTSNSQAGNNVVGVTQLSNYTGHEIYTAISDKKPIMFVAATSDGNEATYYPITMHSYVNRGPYGLSLTFIRQREYASTGITSTNYEYLRFYVNWESTEIPTSSISTMPLSHPCYKIENEELVGITRAELKTLVNSGYKPIYFYQSQTNNACLMSTGGYGVTRGSQGQVVGIITVMLNYPSSTQPSNLGVNIVEIPFDSSKSITMGYKAFNFDM